MQTPPPSPPSDLPVLTDSLHPRRRVSRRAAVIGSIVAAAGARGAASGPGGGGGGRFGGGPGGGGGGRGAATTVGVAAAEAADIPVTLEALGTVVPQATVRVRPQVSGVLQQVLFKEGQT